MFLIINKKTLIALLICAIIIVCGTLYFALQTEYTAHVPKTPYTVVVDAGHGGIDGGSVGATTGVKESELNLAYCLNLANQLKAMGINVVLTRTSESGLYAPGSKNFKKSDMQKRQQIINKSNADLVISIHMNSFPLTSSKGAQVFYKKGNAAGQNLADSIQDQFIALLPNARKFTLPGDYYMVNCTALPAVIVECGYLTNPVEEKLLQTKDYQNKVCYAIVCGVLEFLNLSKY